MEYYLNNGGNDWHLNLACAIMANVDWPQAGPNQSIQQDISDQSGLVSQMQHQDVRPRDHAAPASQHCETIGHQDSSC